MHDKKTPFENGPWTVNNGRAALDNPWIKVIDYAVTQPTGGPGQYGVIHFKNRAIGVLPIDDKGRVPIVGQHRFPLNQYSWELPEGGGPLHEDPLDAAKRELAEETGYVAENWLELASFDVSNSVSDETSICYLATGLTPGPSKPDPDEVLETRLIPFRALHAWVLSGEIRDSLTVIMVLMAYNKAVTGSLPEMICDKLVRD